MVQVNSLKHIVLAVLLAVSGTAMANVSFRFKANTISDGPMKRTTGLKRLAFVSAGFKVSSPPVLNSEL